MVPSVKVFEAIEADTMEEQINSFLQGDVSIVDMKTTSDKVIVVYVKKSELQKIQNRTGIAVRVPKFGR